MAQSAYSLAFNGSTGEITASSAHLPSSGDGAEMSISLWVKYADDTADYNLISHEPTNDRWVLFIEGGNIKWRGNLGATNQVVAAAPSDGVWHHICAVIKNYTSGVHYSYVRLYVDGSLVASGGPIDIGSGSSVQRFSSSSGDIDIGALSDVNIYYLNGNLDDVAIFDYCLDGAVDDTSDIEALADGSLDVATLSPIYLWRMEEGYGTTTAEDIYGSTGNLAGGVTWSDDVPTQIGFVEDISTAATYAKAAWALEEASGTRDDSVASYDLTAHNGVGSTHGIIGEAASFVAADLDWLEVPMVPPTGVMTISFWMRTSSSSQMVMGFNDSFNASSGTFDRSILVYNDGYLQWYIYNSGPHVIASNDAINDGNWHHVAVVIDPTNIWMYIDGWRQKQTVASNGGGYNSYATPYFLLGLQYAYGVSSQAFNGDIDDLVILDGYALTKPECDRIFTEILAFADWGGGGGGGTVPIFVHHNRMQGAA